MKSRKLVMLEIEQKLYVATPTPLHPDYGDGGIILARRDGTEAVVLIRRNNIWRCSCDLGRAGRRCRHFLAADAQQLLALAPVRPQASVVPLPHLAYQPQPKPTASQFQQAIDEHQQAENTAAGLARRAMGFLGFRMDR